MEPKTPTLLLVQIEAAKLRWFVAALGLDGSVLPLLRSEVGDLDAYRQLAFDEQLAFLRHRLCGVLQRGTDRLWARNRKACQFALIFDKLLPDETGQLTQTLAAHFAEWLLQPAVVVYRGGVEGLSLLAGTIAPNLEALLRTALPAAVAQQAEPDAWELARQNGVWCTSRAAVSD